MLAALVSTDAFQLHRFPASNRAAASKIWASNDVMVHGDVMVYSEPAADATAEEKMEFVSSLAEDDEWRGLAMELSAVVVKAVDEDMKKLTRDFLGKEEYKV